MDIILVVFYFFLIVYAFLQRQRVRIIPWLLIVLSSAAIYFVLLPKHATLIANILGVGRGADLLLYSWFVIGSLVLFFIVVKIKKIHEEVTDLARSIAIQGAKKNQN